jgi:dipeptidyl aminopeptidase/acylaminoacyl peptidase
MNPLKLAEDAPWKRRFRVSSIRSSLTAALNPRRGLVASNRSGLYQLHAWEVETGSLRQLTDQPAGAVFGGISPDGEHVYYLRDTDGDEVGHYVRVPFAGGPPQDITPGMPPYASYSISQSLNRRLLGFTAAGDDGFGMYLMSQADDHRLGDPVLLYRSQRLSFGPLLSYDGDYGVIATTERSQYGELALLAFAIGSGSAELSAVLQEDEGSLTPVSFAPVPGDTRLLATTDASGFDRPVIWDVKTGDRIDLPLTGIEGDIGACDWSQDGNTLLLYRVHQAMYRLYRYDLEHSTLHPLDHPTGSYSGAYFVPGSGEIFAHWQDSVHPPQVIALDASSGVLRRAALQPETAPPGRSWRSVSFPSSGQGVTIQGWLALPEGEGPFPAILHTHGGPAAVQTEVFDPEAQSWLDHGFAWLSINYRGSTTFGREFEQAIWGIPGHREVDDMAAAYHWLVASGFARPDAVFVTGRSYGGYLTLQALGRHPDLWAGGMAVVAIADWFRMYEDQIEMLRGHQRSLFGGTPDELPELHRASSPITYVDVVSAPVLVIQGRNDSRCPARQLEAYAAELTALGKSIEVRWFEAGHGVFSTEQAIQHQEWKLDFAYRVLAASSQDGPT